MARFLTCILILWSCLPAGNSYGQQAKRHKPPPPPEVEFNSNCYSVHHLSFAQRTKNYPFNKAAKIAIAGFRDTKTVLVPVDSVASCTCIDDPFSSVPVSLNKAGGNSKMEEVVVLDTSRIDSLTTILYNFGYQNENNYRTVQGCYYPHNAILFYDKAGEVFAFLELCFTCTGKRASDKKITNPIAWCDGKFDLLKKFFLDNGVTTGTTIIPMLPEEVVNPKLNTR